ncbi:uncharacterized protein LOC128893658 isoform X1 [Hylaeus anthracinus]|uniref:uncharacterized protein LOC128893658 isoform X1 n=1 Tax=Hylaeus anthracinus TaxID=313031 RepID=UPI0023B9B0BF|nr:uncharacterized protein LOC128893658 isoform X1 [Hylaeus anthracinus]
MTAASALFHRNVLLLSNVIAPSDEFNTHFHKGMFDKPNTTGFIHVSHYLLTIYDSERFKKLVEWPVICKKTEVKYRNTVKDFLKVVSLENPDMRFPNILTSHLIHAGGKKVTIIMCKLSEVAMRKYLITSQSKIGNYNVILAPQGREGGSLGKEFLQKTNAKRCSNISNVHGNLSAMSKTTETILKNEKKILSDIRMEIFKTEKLITTISNDAPVHPSVKKRITDPNDEDVIQMWKSNINDSLNYLKKKKTILRNMEELSCKIINVMPNNSSDTNILDAKQLQKVNYLGISELFPHDIQCLLFQLYKDEKLVFHTFIFLFNLLLTRLHQRLSSTPPENFSKCLLQIGASCEDMKKALTIFETYLLDVTKKLSETENILHQTNVVKIHDDTVSPIINNVLLMASPVIRIDTDSNNEESDLQKLVQFTPVEAVRKSLFSRYERLKENYTPRELELEENLLVTRINFDDTIMSASNEKSRLRTISMSSKKCLSPFKHTEKYSRLFSTRVKRTNRTANSSVISAPGSSKAHSTAIINAIEEMHISELGVNISTNSVEFVTSEKCPIDHQDKFKDISDLKDIVNDLPSKPDIEITGNCDNNIVGTKQKAQRRCSIGDLVERYKKILERSNRTSSTLE